jgi:hypothetical protein
MDLEKNRSSRPQTTARSIYSLVTTAPTKTAVMGFRILFRHSPQETERQNDRERKKSFLHKEAKLINVKSYDQ